jgi:hypothetical protein
MIKKISYVSLFCIIVAVFSVITLTNRFPLGPVVLALSIIPLAGITLAKRSLKRAIPDLIFGSLDTGLLTIPALWGGSLYGIAGAIAGGVVGDALTDSIAGFFEGSIAKWLRNKGIEESREPITTALGKMAGCLLGSGTILSLALLIGIQPPFAN